jgi:hypothetical protein
MSKRLTFYSSTKPALRHFSGGPSGCSEDALSEVQKVRSLPINRVKPLSSGASAAPYYGGWSDFPSLDAPGYRPYYLVGSTDIAGHDAGWTEVVIPGGLPVLGNLDRRNFDGACYKDNCISRSPGVTEGSEFSCPTNNEVT